MCRSEEVFEGFGARLGIEDFYARGADFGDEESLAVADFAQGAEHIDTGGFLREREAGCEREGLGEPHSESSRAFVAEDDIAHAGEFEFRIRPFSGLGETAFGFPDGVVRGLEVAVVGEGRLDGGLEADAECRHGGHKDKKSENFEMHEWKHR